MARFILRTPRTPTRTVEIPRKAALLVPEALRHVSHHVFEDEQDERHHLQDAASAVADAVGRGSGATVAVEISDEEGRHVPEALDYVGHEVYRDRPEEALFRKAAQAVSDVFPSPSGPRR